MRKILPILILSFIFGTVPVKIPVALAASDLPPARVAIISYKTLMRDSIAAKQIRADIEKIRTRYKTSFQDLEKELEAEREKLLASKETLSQEAYDKRRRAFQDKLISAQRRAQDRSRQLDDLFAEAMKKVQAALVPILEDYIKNHGLNIVVDETHVYLGAKTLDITDVVMVELNKKLTRVPISAPAK